MHFQGRGNVYLAEAVEGVIGAYKHKICPDTFSVDLSTEFFEHINKCGPHDVADYRGVKSSSGRVSFSFANVEDRNYALAVLGTVTAAATGSVSGEALPDDLETGDFWFLGGLTRHRNITALVIAGLTVNTDYTLDAASGRITMLTDNAHSPAITASYSYSDPASVSMLTAATKEYAVMFEFINKPDANDPGSIELYRVRLDPASNMDYLSDELQIPQIAGSILADTTKDADDSEFGQFGRRVL